MSDPGTELDLLVKQAASRLESGTLSLDDLLAALAPAKPEKVEAPVQVATPVSLTKAQKEALDKVPEVYGAVVPTERRMLEPKEVSQLVEEKQTLDELKKLAESRHKDIRTTIFNHLDVEAEQVGLVDDETFREKDTGHYVLDGVARGEPDSERVFKRETRNNSPNLSPAMLKAMAEDPEYPDFTHEDYLSMTTQTRVLDENKLMLALKNNPSLIRAVAQATTRGTKTASINLRKA